MADLKFSCSQCGQHISCDAAWAGQQLQCPACQVTLVVPQNLAPPPPAAAQSSSLVPEPPAGHRPKLSAGLTQVARGAPAAPAAQKRPPPRPPKTGNPALKFAVIGVLLAVVGLLAYNFLPGLLGQVQDLGASKTTGASPAQTGGGVGPMGEVNGAMDVSDALDGGAPSRANVAPRRTATNSVARPKKER